MRIEYSIFKTRFGLCLVASTPKGICNILFADSKKDLLADFTSRWSEDFIEKSNTSHKKVEKYFKDFKNLSKIKIDLHGTDFQVNVWKNLISVKSGETSTYGDIAAKIGNKKMSRAVGTAVGKNPIGYIIPCHRILTSMGGMGGYRWGLERKKSMLEHESSLLSNPS